MCNVKDYVTDYKFWNAIWNQKRITNSKQSTHTHTVYVYIYIERESMYLTVCWYDYEPTHDRAVCDYVS